MDTLTPTENAKVNLDAARIALDTACGALREIDNIGESQRRSIVGRLDDVQSAIARAGQSYQRLNERSAQRPPIASPAIGELEGDGPTVIVHEQGQGPRPGQR
jgi:hypothetical protein